MPIYEACPEGLLPVAATTFKAEGWRERGDIQRLLKDRIAALVLPEVNAEATGLHLAEIGRRVAPGAHAIVLCDGAGWHQQGGRSAVPDNLTLLPLPPYAPELNAMENVWEYLRGNRLSHKVRDAHDAILDACCHAWNSLAEEPQRLTSITNRSWAKAVIE